MSLKDYCKTRDKFENSDGRHCAGFEFPCSVCKYVKQSATIEPCRTCDHNANAAPAPSVCVWVPSKAKDGDYRIGCCRVWYSTPKEICPSCGRPVSVEKGGEG